MEEIKNSENVYGNVAERKKNPIVNVKINCGLGAVVLVGGVLATTVLTSVFFPKRKKGDKVENREVFDVLDQSSIRETRDVNLGYAEDQVNASSPPEKIEIGGEKTKDLSSEQNVESGKLENGDTEYFTVNHVESHGDSMNMKDQAPVPETVRDMLGNVTSQPSEENSKLIEVNGDATLDLSTELNNSLVLDRSNAEIGDVISSVGESQSLDNHFLSDKAGPDTVAASTPGDLSAEPTCRAEKIQSLTNLIQGEKTVTGTTASDVSDEPNAAYQDQIFGTEDETITLHLSYPSPDQSTDGECYTKNIQTTILDQMPCNDKVSNSVGKIDSEENEQRMTTEESEERKQMLVELVGKFQEDRLVKDDGKKLDKDVAVSKYAMLAMENQVIRRRLIFGAVSIATSLAISNLMGLSFIKLCLIMLLTGVLSEIHGR